MGLSNKLSCEAGNFSHCCNSHRFLQSEVLRLYFPSLESWVVWSVSPPSCSSQFICRQMWDHLVYQPPPRPVRQLPPCCESSPSQLPVSAPPTSLGECFFFNSLVVWLPYISFSGSSGCFLFLNLLFSFFWLCKEVQCIYLHLHLGRKSTKIF